MREYELRTTATLIDTNWNVGCEKQKYERALNEGDWNGQTFKMERSLEEENKKILPKHVSARTER
jgi:GH24 family phage-related lysozyme (muramidase)